MSLRSLERQDEKHGIVFDLGLALSCPKWLDVYANDVVIRRELTFENAGKGKEGTRQTIKELSRKSLKRLGFFASNCTQQFYVMLTLTYPEGHTNAGKEVKRHLNNFLTELRRKRKNIKHFWFLEFHKNGSPHFHIFLSTKFIPYKWVAATWNRIVAPDNADHLKASTRTEWIRDRKGAQKYAVLYSSKPFQKIVPDEYQNVGRFWSHSYGIEPQIIQSIQVLGYEDCRHFLRFWKNAHLINHDVILSVLWNVAKYLPPPNL